VNLDGSTVNIDKAVTFGADYLIKVGTTKTNQVRTVPLAQTVVERLRPLVHDQEPTAYLFRGSGSGMLNYGWFRRHHFAPAVKRAGLEGVTIHSLRHTFESLLISNHAAISNVSTHMGHSSSQITLKTYTHAYPAGLKTDIAKMDEIFGPRAGLERGE